MTTLPRRFWRTALVLGLALQPELARSDCAFTADEIFCLSDYDPAACPEPEAVQAELEALVDPSCTLVHSEAELEASDTAGGCCYELHYACEEDLDRAGKGCW